MKGRQPLVSVLTAWMIFNFGNSDVGVIGRDDYFIPTFKPDYSPSGGDLIHHQLARRKLEAHNPGFISIDCGLPEDSLGYTDLTTGIVYTSDAGFIDTGVSMNISSQINPIYNWEHLKSVRSFPQGIKNCYTFKPEQGKNNTYMIRATFMYGNYDDKGQAPKFDLYLGPNLWDSVSFDNATHLEMKEIIHIPPRDYIDICLVNTGSGAPFISALELRLLNNSIYVTKSGSLMKWVRYDYGSTANQPVRYKDDVYDRIWDSATMPHSVALETELTDSTLSSNDYKPPPLVMRTAIEPSLSNGSLEISWNPPESSIEYYIYMHFAGIIRRYESREFSIYQNDNLWYGPFSPIYLHPNTLFSRASFSGIKIEFSIRRNTNSSLPPILNALEIYIVKYLPQLPTQHEDVDAIMNIKKTYGVTKNWQGDPCMPEDYLWDGLNCSYNDYINPRIISLNLASSGLTREIAPSLSNLHSLQDLDLSNNSLTGTIPKFLAQMPLLRTLNLTGNKLTGSVPLALTEKLKNGSLSLSVDGNPDLCVSVPCDQEKTQEKKTKKNKFIVPLVASIVSSLVLLIALAIFWKCKRKGQREMVVKSNKEGSLKSNKGQQFTYSEVVSITNNFQRVIGKGGFGSVYHGYLTDDTQVAVKMLSPLSIQGSKEFRTEAQLLMRVHHRNLTSLVGYCNEGTSMGLIYEYMANGNLQQHLSEKNANVLSWKERIQIAIDAAQGLEYLHSGCKPPIIHRDVKPSNILLNEKLQAKIADFGLSRIFTTESETHVSTDVAGTQGYLDPEYNTTYRLNEKSDVYSFGIVLLQLITGQPAIIKDTEIIHIVNWVMPILERGDIQNIVDPRLAGDFNANSAWKAMETAMACVPPTAIQRLSMSHVLMDLKECLAIEMAYERTWRMENNETRPSHSLEMNPVEFDTEMTPHAR